MKQLFVCLLFSQTLLALVQYPKPAGPYQVGVEPNIFLNTCEGCVPFTISIYYPAQTPQGSEPNQLVYNKIGWAENFREITRKPDLLSPITPSVDQDGWIGFALKIAGLIGWATDWASISARPNLPMLKSNEPGWPVIFFSHGLFSTHHLHLDTIQDLTSHGFVVVAMEHTHSNLVTILPNGEAIKTQDESRAMNIGNRLEQLRIALVYLRSHRKVLNLNNIGIIGNSLGGGLALMAISKDSPLKNEIKAVVILDGGSYGHHIVTKAHILGLLSPEGWGRNGADTWCSGITIMKPGSCSAHVYPGVNHAGFLDLASLSDAWVFSLVPLKNWIGQGATPEFARDVNKRLVRFFKKYL